MALPRGRGGGGQRFSATIWPGFVDAMTALLMVLTFVLTIFMIVQFTLRETINTQDDELTALADQVAGLADALGLERNRTAELNAQVSGLDAEIEAARAAADRQSALITTLTGQLDSQTARASAAEAQITEFEAQVASLLSERNSARGQVATLSSERDELLSAQEALNLAVAKARDEIDAQAEVARLAAARREALQALVADLKAEGEKTAAALSDAEAAQLTEAAAAAALRDRLKGAEDELSSMTLALEDQRRKAEETLTLLAAANAARKDLDTRLAAALLAQSASEAELEAARAAAAGFADTADDRDRIAAELAAALAAKIAADTAMADQLSEAERQRVLLANANSALAGEQAVSAEAARKVALLNEQVLALRGQLGALQELLDASAAKDAEAKVQVEALGSRLNSALAQVASEQRLRAALEETERQRLEAEAQALKAETKELARYRSEFFGKLSEVLAGREGVRVVGDRFVFSSEVLFEPASADLAAEGKNQIAGVVAILAEVAAIIPPEIDWIIRVDGHTDNVPLVGTGKYRDNWELSQGRALSVVRFMQDGLGFPADRLAATGFGEYHPVAEGETPDALAQNRRIELKLTER
ncbi:MAG: peptidoglycan -binding protein [Albidovulum sp.]